MNFSGSLKKREVIVLVCPPTVAVLLIPRLFPSFCHILHNVGEAREAEAT